MLGGYEFRLVKLSNSNSLEENVTVLRLAFADICPFLFFARGESAFAVRSWMAAVEAAGCSNMLRTNPHTVAQLYLSQPLL